MPGGGHQPGRGGLGGPGGEVGSLLYQRRNLRLGHGRLFAASSAAKGGVLLLPETGTGTVRVRALWGLPMRYLAASSSRQPLSSPARASRAAPYRFSQSSLAAGPVLGHVQRQVDARVGPLHAGEVIHLQPGDDRLRSFPVQPVPDDAGQRGIYGGFRVCSPPSATPAAPKVT